MLNGRLDESQPGIKIAGRNINNLRYADDTILMAESEEELKVKESEKAGLKLDIQKTGIPDHLTRLLRNLYAGQEATVRTGHGTTEWSK